MSRHLEDARVARIAGALRARGISALETAQFVAGALPAGRGKERLSAVAESLASGRAAEAGSPGALLASLLATGDAAGADALLAAARAAELEAESARASQSALAHPVALLVAAAIASFLGTIVMPVFATLFDSEGVSGSLPPVSAWILSLAPVLRWSAPPLALLAIVSLLAWRWVSRILPGARQHRAAGVLARFGAASRAGLPHDRALAVAGARRVSAGDSPFAGVPGLLADERGLADRWARTAGAAAAAESLAEALAEDARHRARLALMLFPALVSFVAIALVATSILALVLPIFTITAAFV